jgi:hypothetical protein
MSCSVLTPYYQEEVLFSKAQLNEENEDGVSILFYLQKIYPGMGEVKAKINALVQFATNEMCTLFSWRHL